MILKQGIGKLLCAKWQNVCNNSSTLKMIFFRYNSARMSVSDRVSRVAAVVESLEREMELLCVTGVEDRLQDRVRPTLELLRNAGIKVHRIFFTSHITRE